MPFPSLAGIAVGMQTQVWNGPFPPPQAVDAYERLLPGSFNRILVMGEERQKAELALASKATDAAIADTKRANWMGYSVNFLALVLGGAFIFTGHTGAGVVAFVVQGIVAGTSMFLRRETHAASPDQGADRARPTSKG